MRLAHVVVASLCAIHALANHAAAWNYTGHRLIATFAYEALTPEVRTRVDAILRAHPRCEADLLGDMPQGYDAARYAFAMSGYWPDIVRNQQNPMHFTSHHPQWHFINVRYDLPGAGCSHPRSSLATSLPAFMPTHSSRGPRFLKSTSVIRTHGSKRVMSLHARRSISTECLPGRIATRSDKTRQRSCRRCRRDICARRRSPRFVARPWPGIDWRMF